MIGANSLEQLKQFEEDHVLYAIYLDAGFQPDMFDAVARLRDGFNRLAGSKFHMLFPSDEISLNGEFDPYHHNYRIDIAEKVIDEFSIAEDQLPILLFPSVRNQEALLALNLSHGDTQKAAKEIHRITQIAVKQEPLEDMTPEEFRKNTLKLFADEQLAMKAKGVGLAGGAIIFVAYAPEYFEKAMQIIFG